MKEELLAILTSTPARPVTRVDGTPEVILVVGVNGTGKTTTIGKLSQVFRGQGKTVLLCAADTFRAAAIEQLEIWGQRTGTEVIKTKAGRRSCRRCCSMRCKQRQARKTDYVIVDTAGRLHTKQNLMLGTREDAAYGAAHRSGRAARNLAGDGRDHRPERLAAGEAVYRSRPA